MAKKTVETATNTTTETVTRTARFNVSDLDALAKIARQQGENEWDEVRRLVRERVAGRCVILQGLKPEAFAELQHFADENAVDVEQAVKLIVIKFVNERRKAKK